MATSALESIPRDVPISVRHIGAALDPKLGSAARALARKDPRVSVFHHDGNKGYAVATETAFGVPGLGAYLVQAQNARDWMVIQNLVLLYASVFTLVNLATDLAHAWLDPRIRYD